MPTVDLLENTAFNKPVVNYSDNGKISWTDTTNDTHMANTHTKRCSTSLVISDAGQNHDEISVHTY